MIEPIDLTFISSAAKTLDDIESARISASLRLQQLTRQGPDADGQIRGAGFSEFHPSVMRQQELLEHLKRTEDLQAHFLSLLVQDSPFRPWVARTRGVGLRQAGRLLAATGDPYVAERVLKVEGVIQHVETGPRTKREFLTYCGYGLDQDGRSRRHRRGQRSNWNSDARMRAHLIAVSAMRARGGGPLRDLYVETRAKELAKVDTGHAHARALRRVAKQVLGDLFDEARCIHERDAVASSA